MKRPTRKGSVRADAAATPTEPVTVPPADVLMLRDDLQSPQLPVLVQPPKNEGVGNGQALGEVSGYDSISTTVRQPNGNDQLTLPRLPVAGAGGKVQLNSEVTKLAGDESSPRATTATDLLRSHSQRVASLREVRDAEIARLPYYLELDDVCGARTMDPRSLSRHSKAPAGGGGVGMATRQISRASSRAALAALHGIDLDSHRSGARGSAEIVYTVDQHRVQVEKVVSDVTEVLQSKLRHHQETLLRPHRVLASGNKIPSSVLELAPELNELAGQVDQLRAMYEEQRASNAAATAKLEESRREEQVKLKRAKEKHDPRKREGRLRTLVQKISDVEEAIQKAEDFNSSQVEVIKQSYESLKNVRKDSVKELSFTVKKLDKLRALVVAKRPEAVEKKELCDAIIQSQKEMDEQKAQFKKKLAEEKERQARRKARREQLARERARAAAAKSNPAMEHLDALTPAATELREGDSVLQSPASEDNAMPDFLPMPPSPQQRFESLTMMEGGRQDIPIAATLDSGDEDEEDDNDKAEGKEAGDRKRVDDGADADMSRLRGSGGVEGEDRREMTEPGAGPSQPGEKRDGQQPSNVAEGETTAAIPTEGGHSRPPSATPCDSGVSSRVSVASCSSYSSSSTTSVEEEGSEHSSACEGSETAAQGQHGSKPSQDGKKAKKARKDSRSEKHRLHKSSSRRSGSPSLRQKKSKRGGINSNGDSVLTSADASTAISPVPLSAAAQPSIPEGPNLSISAPIDTNQPLGTAGSGLTGELSSAALVSSASRSGSGRETPANGSFATMLHRTHGTQQTAASSASSASLAPAKEARPGAKLSRNASRGVSPAPGSGVDQNVLNSLLGQHQKKQAAKQAAASPKRGLTPAAITTDNVPENKAEHIVNSHYEGKSGGYTRGSPRALNDDGDGPLGGLDRCGRPVKAAFMSSERHKGAELLNKDLRGLTDALAALSRRFNFLYKRQMELYKRTSGRKGVSGRDGLMSVHSAASMRKVSSRQLKSQGGNTDGESLDENAVGPKVESSSASSSSNSDFDSDDEEIIATMLGMGKKQQERKTESTSSGGGGGKATKPPATLSNSSTERKKNGMTKKTKEIIERQLTLIEDELDNAQLTYLTWKSETKIHDREVQKCRAFIGKEVQMMKDKASGAATRLKTARERRNELVTQYYDFLQQQELAALENERLEASFMMRHIRNGNAAAMKLLDRKPSLSYRFEDFINTNDINKRAASVQNNLEVDLLPQQIRRLIVLGNQEEKFVDHLARLDDLVDTLTKFNDMMAVELSCCACDQVVQNSFLFWPCGHQYCRWCFAATQLEDNTYQCVQCEIISSDAAVPNIMCNDILGRWYFKLSGFHDLESSMTEMHRQLDLISGHHVKELVDAAVTQMEIVAEKGYGL